MRKITHEFIRQELQRWEAINRALDRIENGEYDNADETTVILASYLKCLTLSLTEKYICDNYPSIPINKISPTLKSCHCEDQDLDYAAHWLFDYNTKKSNSIHN